MTRLLNWFRRRHLRGPRQHEFSSYDHYRRAQQLTNEAKRDSVWVRDPEIDFISRIIAARMPQVTFGICHGVRNGHEVERFRRLLKCDVIGTEISSSAEQYAHVIEWDFHDVKDEWLNSVDFIYSNSLDHSYDPGKCVKQWVSCLRPGALCMLHWSPGHNLNSFGMNRADCFQADRDRYIELLEESGTFLDALEVPGDLGRWIVLGTRK